MHYFKIALLYVLIATQSIVASAPKRVSMNDTEPLSNIEKIESCCCCCIMIPILAIEVTASSCCNAIKIPIRATGKIVNTCATLGQKSTTSAIALYRRFGNQNEAASLSQMNQANSAQHAQYQPNEIVKNLGYAKKD